ncbi:MAG: MBL fold metallo-hydrolase [Thiotrichaceae bacterium]
MNMKIQWFALSAVAFAFLVACGEKKTEMEAVAIEPTKKIITEAPTKDVEEVVLKAKLTTGILASYPTKKVAAHTYVIHGPLEMPNKANAGFMNNPAFIVTEKSVAVIDPGSSVQVGRELVKRIKEVTDNPITHVFNTHVHGDHWLANHGIKESFPDAQFYAHPKMIEKSKAGDAEHWVSLMLELTENKTQGTEAVIPENSLENLQEIEIDGLTIKTHLTGKAHTVTDVMYELVEDGVLFTGDNVTYKRIPRMVDGNFLGNIAAADYGLKLSVNVVVPGHGLTGGKEVLSAYRDYLSTVYETSKTLAEEGLETYEMKELLVEKLAGYNDWTGLEEQLGKHISQSVIEAEEADF